jgi:cytochrome c-type biogenesis protein
MRLFTTRTTLIFLLIAAVKVTAFTPLHKPLLQKPTGTRLHLAWDDIVYQAQSAASTLAAGSLDATSESWLTGLPVLYAAGLLTSVSPCVWGLLPVTLSSISMASMERDDQSTTLPTLAFAGGLALVFCSLGVAAAQLGGLFGFHSAVWLNVVSNGICLIMGLRMLEVVNIPLPSFGFAQTSNEPVLIDAKGQVMSKQKQGGLTRTFILGASSAIVASPCATPVLTSVLGYCAQSQSGLLGALFLLSYTIGYATPLLLVAWSGGRVLTRLQSSSYSMVAPWVTPITAGILVAYGTRGLLTAIWGDPSLAGLPVLV